MSELEELKARAAERRKLYSGPGNIYEYEADLDRAIAIAEKWKNKVTLMKPHRWKRLYGRKVRQNERFLKRIDEQESRLIEVGKERDEARAAVLALREAVETASWNCSAAADREGVEFLDKYLADTESYEQYR